MTTGLIIIHILICIGLVLAILLQSGKGSDLGAAFGGSSQTLFGSTGAMPFLNKLTAGVAIGFMITSLSLAFIASRVPKSSIMQGKAKTQQEIPVRAGEQPGIPSGPSTEKE
ncbi:MAG: preprotein translocase subunit SecG [Deltaproteobacteria bacterium]|nr:preprotein translocase subunit SecG [Deltaproteobacteria bacterium]MBW2341434.1 preprotein translocase subunit SecG [Deltaproteobacteria bacterium]